MFLHQFQASLVDRTFDDHFRVIYALNKKDDVLMQFKILVQFIAYLIR